MTHSARQNGDVGGCNPPANLLRESQRGIDELPTPRRIHGHRRWVEGR